MARDEAFPISTDDIIKEIIVPGAVSMAACTMEHQGVDGFVIGKKVAHLGRQTLLPAVGTSSDQRSALAY